MNSIISTLLATILAQNSEWIEKSCYELAVPRYYINNSSRLLGFPVTSIDGLTQSAKASAKNLLLNDLGYPNQVDAGIKSITEYFLENNQHIYKLDLNGEFYKNEKLKYNHSIYISANGEILNRDELPKKMHFMVPVATKSVGISYDTLGNANNIFLIFSKKADSFLYCGVYTSRIEGEIDSFLKTTRFFRLDDGKMVFESSEVEYSDY